MHDIWNPWHGCVKCSEGCDHCYMYFLDRVRDQDGSRIYKTKTGFRKPIQKDRQGRYKIQSGETLWGKLWRRIGCSLEHGKEEAHDRAVI